MRVIRIEQAIVEGWGVLPHLARCAPAIVAVRDRRTSADQLIEVLGAQPWIRGAGEQRRLFSLLAAGNHSELEIWGHQKVFTDKALPRSVTQHHLQVGSNTVYLDRAFLEEMVAVELDGAAYHGSPGQRERDLRRDAGVAQLGWLTVRYSHPRLHTDPGGVVDELVRILARRREQLRASA
jgi:very-short-patch-repair endonuclease